MNAVRKIVVVGGGPAAVAAALAAKQQDAAADVVLLSDESQEPYEKPPLSKAVLTGKAMPHDAPIAGPRDVAASGVRLKLRSEEHTSELQSQSNIVCRLLLEKKNRAAIKAISFRSHSRSTSPAN